MKLVLIFERRHIYFNDYEEWGINFFKKIFSDIELWSFVDWTFDNCPIPLNGLSGKNIYYLSCKKDLFDNLNRIKNENVYFLIYPYHAYSYKSYLIRKSIRNYGFHFSNITESPLINNIFAKKNVLQIIIEQIYCFFKSIIFYSFGVISQKQYLINRGYDNFFRIFGFLFASSDFNFVTTSVLFYSFPNYFEKFSKKNIFLHSESYEEYLNLNNKVTSTLNQKYAVFIDQFSAGHSDCIKLKRKPDITDSKKYYKDLSNLFNKIEEIYSYKVIIAAHPKAEYKGDEFGNREIVYFKTSELIKNSCMVINQNSTAFGLACLYKKDFLHIYSKEMFENNPNNKTVYKKLDSFFNSSLLDISNYEAVEHLSSYVCHCSESRFFSYIDLFIISSASKSKTKSKFEIISEYLSDRTTQLFGNIK